MRESLRICSESWIDLGAGHTQLLISRGSLHLLYSKYGLLAFLLSYFRLENKIKLPYEIEHMNFDSLAKLCNKDD